MAESPSGNFDKAGLERQLNHALTQMASENQILWSISGIFWAANAILLVALFQSGDWPKKEIGTVISAVGIAISLAWFGFSGRAMAYITILEKTAVKIEQELQIPNQFMVTIKKNPETDKALGTDTIIRFVKGTLIPVRWVMRASCALAFALWIIFLFRFAF